MSYVVMPSAEVKRRAQAMIEKIEASREAEKQAILEDERKSLRGRWFKLWEKRELELDDIRQPGEILCPVRMAELSYGNQYDLAKTLLRMAEMAPEVHVEARHVYALVD